jgi:hypothetical protein
MNEARVLSRLAGGFQGVKDLDITGIMRHGRWRGGRSSR